jgi:molybdopterin-dependent oxidoreductase alpha subunit
LFGSKISDLYVQPNIGSDTILLLGIIKWLSENGAVDNAFVQSYVDGFDGVQEQARSTSWDTITEQCGIDEHSIGEVASMYAASSNAIFCWAMGITHNQGGVDAVRMIANTAMARGMLGKQGAGLLPLRGHSNVQGMGSVGVVPTLKGAMATAIEKQLHVTLPTTKGFDTMASIQAAHAGGVDFALCLGGNLAGSNPDTRFAMEAMSNIGLVSYMSTTLNQGHFVGRGKETIILPVLARDEEQQTTTQESMFNYVRRSSGGVARHEGPRSEVDIIVDLATTGVGVVDWSKYKNFDAIRELLANCMAGFNKDEEHQISGRTFHSPKFATESGKAKAHVVPLQKPKSTGGSTLRLMTIRSEGQFNTVVYEEEDVFRGQSRRDIVMMNEKDISELKLEINKMVTVRGPSGEMQVVVRSIDIAKGNCAMYFPEVNVILSTKVDGESFTPLFKGELVEIFR